ncbi:hypothetical protein EWH99_03745 [Sporolactobacillus sp. THM7-7]|nr:hypothetical protein EWH99_03745 [Sporolactobacillus sp. THM7-7]
MRKHPFYVALGDSLTVGVGSTLFLPDFVAHYRKTLETVLRQPVGLRVLAKNGATTEDILYALQHPEVEKTIREADVITITAGGNAVCWLSIGFTRTRPATWSWLGQPPGLASIRLSLLIHPDSAPDYIPPVPVSFSKDKGARRDDRSVHCPMIRHYQIENPHRSAVRC